MNNSDSPTINLSFERIMIFFLAISEAIVLHSLATMFLIGHLSLLVGFECGLPASLFPLCFKLVSLAWHLF